MKSKNQNRLIEIYGMLLIDCICACTSYFLALIIRFGSPQNFEHSESYQAMFLWVILFLILYKTLIGSSRNFLKRGYWVEFKSIVKEVFCLTIYLVAVMFLIRENYFSRLVYGIFAVIYFILGFGIHCAVKYTLRKTSVNKSNEIQLIVITLENEAELLLKQLKPDAKYRYTIQGVMTWDEDPKEKSIGGIPVITGGSNIIDEIKRQAVDEVLIYLPEISRKAVGQLIMELELMGVTCHYCLDTVGLGNRHVSIDELGGLAVATYTIRDMNDGRLLIKRFIDILGALVGLLITGIVYIFLAPAIKLDSPGPVVFSQTRIGRNGRRFKIYKFRSMYIDAEKRKAELAGNNEMSGLMFKLEDDPRVTKVGRFIRKTSLDEFPQFWNVLKGEMSLVGTRPPTEDEFEQYTTYYRRRLCMTPGLTGMWQVSGRSDIKDFDQVVKLDLHYIDHWSLSLDVKILFQTVYVVLFGRGAK